MLTSWSEVVDAGRVVDEVGVHPAAAERVLDAAAWVKPEVAALADDLGAQLGARRPGPRRWPGPPRRRATRDSALT